MRYSRGDVGEVLAIVVDGPLEAEDAHTLTPSIEEALQSGRQLFVIDLTKVPYADSAGLEVLIEVTTQVVKSGGRLGMFGADDVLGEILRVTRLNKRLALFRSREEALARVRDEGANRP